MADHKDEWNGNMAILLHRKQRILFADKVSGFKMTNNALVLLQKSFLKLGVLSKNAQDL